MQRTHAIQVKAMVLTPAMAAMMQNVVGQLAPTSRKTYTIDVKHFAQWLADQELSLYELIRDDQVDLAVNLRAIDLRTDVGRCQATAR